MLHAIKFFVIFSKITKNSLQNKYVSIIILTVLIFEKLKGEKIMNKVSKLLVMALVVLAVVTMSLNVNASTSELKSYVGTYHTINGMIFELTNAQKQTVVNYVAGLDDATSASIMNDIKAAEKLVGESGATSIAKMSKSVKSEVIALGKSAAQKAGLTLTVNTANNTFALTKSNGETLISGNADALIVTPSTTAAGTTTTTTTGKTLLYTGANYAVYAVAALAIVAVAVVVKKRA